MKKMNNPTRMETNKRSLARWAFAVACLAFLLVGNSALAAPPANDNFADATVIPASPPATVTGNNTDATQEGGEPLHSDYFDTARIGTNSIWWSWTPADSGTVTIDTVNSAIDTELAVYTGSSVGSLSQVAVNEDDAGLANGWSKLSFNATSGTTYHIAVTGFENIGGNVSLNFTSGGTTNPPPPADGLTLTINTTGSGTVTKDPNKSSYDTNEVVTLTANPIGTNTFLGWGGDAAAEGTNNPIQVTMDAAKTVTAAFTTTAGGGGGGGGTGVTSIVVLTTGEGRVTPNLNNKDKLRVGKRYRLTAHPDRDWVFAGWDGAPASAEVDGSKLSFIMEPGLTITANFAPNPFIDAGIVGNYNGLVMDAVNTNGVSQDCSGEFTLKVSKNGKFSGRIKKGKQSLPFNGNILPDGTVTGAKVGRGKNATGTIDLQFDMTNHTDRVTGTVTAENCVATLDGDRQAFSAKNPTPLQGKYTLVFPRDENNANGNGFATINVSKTGKVKLRGELADGAKISDSTTVAQNGQVPVYIPLYKKEGSLVGWLNLSTTNAAGLFSWIKPAGDKVLPNGFETDIEAVGSPFDPKAQPFLTLSNGIVEIGGSDLAQNLTIPVTVGDKNTISASGTNSADFNLKMNSNGLLQGNFVDTTTQKNTKLRGVVLQNGNAAAGYFLSADMPGFFEVFEEGSIIDTNQVTTNQVEEPNP